MSCLIGIINTVSTALQGKVKINTEIPGWNETVNFYTFFIAPSGSRKSGFIEILKEPLLELITERQKHYDETNHNEKIFANEKNKALNKLSNMEISRLVKEHKDNGVNFDAMLDEIDQITLSIKSYRDKNTQILNLSRPNLFTDNFTSNGLLKALKNNGEFQSIF
jgi:hypothetical protein